MRSGVQRTTAVARVRQGGDAGFNRSVTAPIRNGDNRALVAKFFLDLRHVLRLTLPQAAYLLQIPVSVIEALELGHVEYLPPWPETSRIVIAYASMANCDGRPVLNAIAGLLREAQPQTRQTQQPERRQAQPANRPLLRAGTAFANGAKRLPAEAIDQIRRRPQRTLYTLSVPLLALFMLLHGAVFDAIARPFASTVNWLSGYFQEHFAPVRDGLRYIEVDDPRSRRGDKLRIGSGSY
jgi:hypothetical protein